ncbi:MAG: chemotaxis protein CheW [Flavobacteriales bacterium]|nr:chemotaxis protein CheW [Flavobacteriales bacterium]
MSVKESIIAPGVTRETEAGKTSHLTIQMIVFQLGNEEYAVPIEVVKEVVITPEIASMPEAPDHILGVGNIRGNIIAIIDLVNRFGIQKADYSQTNGSEVEEGVVKKQEKLTSYTLVVEADGFTSGILLDNVPDSLAITEENIERNTSVMLNAGSGTDYVKGIITLDERLIILIDVLTILNEEMENVNVAELAQ